MEGCWARMVMQLVMVVKFEHFFGRLEAHLCGWMENWKGCVSIQGGGAMPKFWNQANYFWDFDSAMAVVVFLLMLNGEFIGSHQ